MPINDEVRDLVDKFSNLCKDKEGGDVITASIVFLVQVHKVYRVPFRENAENLKNLMINIYDHFEDELPKVKKTWK